MKACVISYRFKSSFFSYNLQSRTFVRYKAIYFWLIISIVEYLISREILRLIKFSFYYDQTNKISRTIYLSNSWIDLGSFRFFIVKSSSCQSDSRCNFLTSWSSSLYYYIICILFEYLSLESNSAGKYRLNEQWRNK